MRLIEVGTKQQSLNHPEKAYDLFNKAYDLYCLFWGLNMGLVDAKNVKWEKDDPKKLEAEVKALKVSMPVKKEPATDGSAFGKFKAFVRKAVDCCIE